MALGPAWRHVENDHNRTWIKMKKLINRTSDFVDEMLKGLMLAHPSMSLDDEARRVVGRTQSARLPATSAFFFLWELRR